MELSKRKYVSTDENGMINKCGIIKLNNNLISEILEYDFIFKIDHYTFESYYCFATGKKIFLNEIRHTKRMIYNRHQIEKAWNGLKYELIIMSNGNQYITIV